jgi:hypothetical protein
MKAAVSSGTITAGRFKRVRVSVASEAGVPTLDREMVRVEEEEEEEEAALPAIFWMITTPFEAAWTRFGTLRAPFLASGMASDADADADADMDAE